MKDSIRCRFVMAWLCSALIVAGVRFFHAVPMNLDLALQIQAAQNLFAGKGLSIYSRTAPDLAAPTALVPLTTFPSGYSFYTAAILALRGNEATAIRLLAAASTMLGWWGWAILAYPFFSDKM